MSKQIVIDIVEKLKKYNTIVVTSHINPDGDAISSSYGLGLALKKAFPQKKILVVGEPDEIEKRFRFLKLKRNMFISPTQKVEGDFVAIIGDTSVSSRINGYEIVKQANTKICFDHHDTSADITFPTATASWGTVGWIGIYDASTSGNLLYHTPLDVAKTIDSGDIFKITAGNLSVTLA